MNRFALFFALATVAHAQQLLAPAPTITVTIHLCAPGEQSPECDAKLRQWQRKKDIETLVPLLLEEFKNTTTINRAARDREAVIMARMVKSRYD